MCKHDKIFIIGLLLLLAPLGLASALWWLPIVFWLWTLPAWGWQVLALLATGVFQATPGRRAVPVSPAPPAGVSPVSPSTPLTPAQQASYDDMRAKGWSERAARQATARLAP